MVAVVVHKDDRSSEVVQGGVIVLSEPSVVRLSLSRTAIKEYQRDGDDLVLKLHAGQTIRIKNFYVKDHKGVESDLVLQDENGDLWLGKHSDGLADFDFSEVQAAGAASDNDWNLALLGLGLLGAGVAVAAAGGAGGGGGVSLDTTPPEAPIVTVGNDGVTLSIRGEKNTIAKIYDQSNNLVGEVKLSEEGTGTFVLPNSNGGDYVVTLTDDAGNTSDGTDVTVPDTLAPDAPTNLIVDELGSSLSGIGEAGAHVLVYDSSHNLVAEGDVADDGTFIIDLNGSYQDGEEFEVRLQDAAGNVSEQELQLLL